VIEVAAPDEGAASRARCEVVAREMSGSGGLGRLGELAVWLAGTQGRYPPQPPQHPRLILFSSAQGSPGPGVLAASLGIGLRVAELGSGVGGGPIEREDALSGDALEAALATGRDLVDAEVDAGTDLLLAGHLGGDATEPTAVIVAAMTGTEPVAVLSRGAGSGVDDATWMRRATVVRDALRRVHAEDAQWEPLRLLAMIAGPDLAALTSALAQAAVRRTPVLLDGPAAAACALVAEQMAPGASHWWQAAQVSTEPGQGTALTRLGLRPLLDLGLRDGDGTGALLALPVLSAAGALLS
jgi:nicotinate-nucleotide--dimethylbenzimidazole phosphoribosyltransferase